MIKYIMAYLQDKILWSMSILFIYKNANSIKKLLGIAFLIFIIENVYMKSYLKRVTTMGKGKC